jgi:hypothetical protein
MKSPPFRKKRKEITAFHRKTVVLTAIALLEIQPLTYKLYEVDSYHYSYNLINPSPLIFSKVNI